MIKVKCLWDLSDWVWILRIQNLFIRSSLPLSGPSKRFWINWTKKQEKEEDKSEIVLSLIRVTRWQEISFLN